MPVITGATVFGVRRLLDGKILSDPVLVSRFLARLSMPIPYHRQCKQRYLGPLADG